MTNSDHRNGFTLVEILTAVSIIGLLAVFIIPAYILAVRNRQNAQVANQLNTAVLAFELYAAETGGYPATKGSGATPPEMADYYFPYFKIDWWGNTNELGGRWGWNNGGSFKRSVSIASPTVSTNQLIELDKLVDDGNLSSGKFRQVGTQYHYIIEQ